MWRVYSVSKPDCSTKTRAWRCEVAAVVAPGDVQHLVNGHWLYKLHVHGAPLGFAAPSHGCRNKSKMEFSGKHPGLAIPAVRGSSLLCVWSTVLQRLHESLQIHTGDSAWVRAGLIISDGSELPRGKEELKALKREVGGMNGEYCVFLCRARSVALNSEPFRVQLMVILFRSPWFCCFKCTPPLKWKKIKYIYLCGAFCELVGHILNNPGNC